MDLGVIAGRGDIKREDPPEVEIDGG